MGVFGGIKNYVKPAPKAAAPAPAAPAMSEKTPVPNPTQRRSQPATPINGNISSRASIAPSTMSTRLMDIRYEVMAAHLQQTQEQKRWIRFPLENREGIFVRRGREDYIACPSSLADQNTELYRGVMDLNARSVMTVASRTIESFLEHYPDAVDVPLAHGQSVQILPTYLDLGRARKHQYAAFIAQECLLVVWDDDTMHLEQRAADMVEKLTNLVWQDEHVPAGGDEEKKVPEVMELEVDSESGEIPTQHRRTRLMNTTLVAITLVLIVSVLGAGFRELAMEISVDHNMLRVAFVALTPIQVFFTLFFAQVIVGCVAQIIGPTQQMKTNSKFYSYTKSPRLPGRDLPHVTIQCPVYKEGLASVIMPTVRSIKEAISTYELQGGSANMLINDDGIQGFGEEDRQERIDFYADNAIGWVARPNHNAILLDGSKFVKKGKFKKASNMNYGLMMSCQVEEILQQVVRDENWTQEHEARAYGEALETVMASRPDAWADGNIRIGDYILLIDSDTRVPTDCLLDAASEMEQSPEVGIMQFSSGVMQVQHDYFENGITFFTNLIYSAIRYTVSNGDVAPFVGHNAILRWAAIQQVSYQDEDGYDKFWSESHVSEDFDMSLRLQCTGYIIRLAAWADYGFKEGVSLTVYDELARWEKYAFGCNELLFHPILKWPMRGPFTPLFRKFLFSNIRFTSKVTIISYIGTYYAIGAAWIMTTANYFAIGWFNGYLDKYYIDSWKVWFSIVIVFNGLGNVALAAMRYRDEENGKGFFANLLMNFKWTFMLCIFLGGLSLHVSQALLSHMFGIDMTWGATSKESTRTNFFIEVPKILKKFKFSMAFAIFAIIGMIVLGTGLGSVIPYDWQIKDFVAILPMATVAGSHLLLPIVLNPGLMTFSW